MGDWEDWENEDFVPTKEEDEKFNDEIKALPVDKTEIKTHHSAHIKVEPKNKKPEYQDTFGQTRTLTAEERAE